MTNMADRTESVPESATLGGKDDVDSGEAALRAALDEHGDELATVVDSTDELQELISTALLVVASAEDEEIDYATDTVVHLYQAVDGLATEDAATLAGDVGENAEDLSAALDALVELNREGNLDEFVELATQLSALELDPDAVAGMNTLLAAVGDAQQESEPLGFIDAVGELWSRDARAGLGYLVTVLKAVGRRHRQ